MRVLFLSAANSIHTVRWVNELAERGHEIHLVYNAGHEPKENIIKNTIHLHCLKHSGGKAYYLNAKELRALSEKIKPEIINVHYASGYGTLARRAGLKHIILSVWGSDVYEFPYKNPINKIILKKNIKHAGKVASTSECMAEQLRKVVENNEIDIDITPFGVDMEKFNPVKRMDKKTEDIILGTVKTLNPIYRIDDFIKAVSLLETKVKIYIYGDGQERDSLQLLIEELGLQERVFLKGKIPNVDVPKALQEFDVFCAMSEKESFGVAVVEAMAMELPVVVSDADGFKEVVVHGENGYIVPVGDTRQLAKRLEALIADSQLRNRMGKSGRIRAEQLYDWHKNVDIMENIYNQSNRKKCIVHIPNSINTKGTSGSQLRPRCMMQAFKDCGYEVEIIQGESEERKKQIQNIKSNIKKGMKYEFVYSESSTMPTLLTNKNHFPRNPFMDFSFFRYCRKHEIKIGLFYRDIQWKFPFYKAAVSLVKRIVSIPMYKYDLLKYKKLVDILYLPSERMQNYLLEYPELLKKADILMPGCGRKSEGSSDKIEKFENEGIHVFYVGGVTGIYDMSVFFETMSKIVGFNTIICCREKEWNEVKEKYSNYLNSNIRVVHASGAELEKYYEWADICSVFAGAGEYFSMSMPVKVFEYLGNEKPMLGIKGTTSGELIEKENIGWTTEYSTEALMKVCADICTNPKLIEEKKESIKSKVMTHTWKARAQKVIKDMEA